MNNIINMEEYKMAKQQHTEHRESPIWEAKAALRVAIANLPADRPLSKDICEKALKDLERISNKVA